MATVETAHRQPLRRIACSHGDVAWREAGAGTPLVLLHGIGSASASWTAVLDQLASQFRVLAWDAPGYGDSAPLAVAQPLSPDYADAVAQSLAQLGVQRPIVVGHSLGALVAAAWAARPDAMPRAVVLASPARGYGRAEPALREARFRDRMALVERLGIEGMARERAAALCAPGREAGVVEQVRANMARATPGGYRQAAGMLAHDDLVERLHGVRAPIAVLCGALDTVTPPAACEEVARSAGAPFSLLPGVAHACYVEDPAAFCRSLLSSLALIPGALHE